MPKNKRRDRKPGPVARLRMAIEKKRREDKKHPPEHDDLRPAIMQREIDSLKEALRTSDEALRLRTATYIVTESEARVLVDRMLDNCKAPPSAVQKFTVGGQEYEVFRRDSLIEYVGGLLVGKIPQRLIPSPIVADTHFFARGAHLHG